MMNDVDNNEYYNYCVSFQRLSSFTRLEQKLIQYYLHRLNAFTLTASAYGPWWVSYAFKSLKCQGQGQSPVDGLDMLEPLSLIPSLRIVNDDLETPSNGFIVVSLHDFALGNYFKNAL